MTKIFFSKTNISIKIHTDRPSIFEGSLKGLARNSARRDLDDWIVRDATLLAGANVPNIGRCDGCEIDTRGRRMGCYRDAI